MDYRSLALEPDPGNVRAARQFVHELLDCDDFSSIRDLTVLLTSELVTNAFLHAASHVEVRVACNSENVTVEVCDWGAGEPRILSAAPLSLGGRGMALVDTLTDDWGVRQDDSAKTVWFTIAHNAERG